MTPQNIDSVKSTIAACVAANCRIFVEGYIDAKGASKNLLVRVIGREGYIELVKASLDALKSNVIDPPDNDITRVDWLEAVTQLEESLTRTLEGLNVPREFVADLEDSGNGYFRNPLKPGVVILRHMLNQELNKCTPTADLLANSRTGVTAAKKYIGERLPLACYIGQLNIEKGRYTAVTDSAELKPPAPVPTAAADFPKATEISVLADSYVANGLLDVRDYQALALRTEAPTYGILERILSNPDRYVRLIHASLGLSSEMGELLESEDPVNTRGELSDFAWFSAVGLHALGKPLMLLDQYVTSPIPAENIKHSLEFLTVLVAEFADSVKAHVFYGKQEFKKEDGTKISADEMLAHSLHTILGLVAGLAVANGTDFLSILRANIAKLSARYPNKYSQEAALNRDTSKENAAIVSAVK